MAIGSIPRENWEKVAQMRHTTNNRSYEIRMRKKQGNFTSFASVCICNCFCICAAILLRFSTMTGS